MNQSRDIFLDIANYIATRLCRDALWDRARCNWLGASMEFIDNHWTIVHRALGSDFYSGTSGIALFLARIFKLTNEKLFRSTAKGATQQALSRVKDIHPTAHIGFYTGLTGIAYTVINIGKIFDDENYVHKGLQILENLAKDGPNAQQGLDVISGSAGAIPVLLNIYQLYKKDCLLDLAIRQGDLLLETARKSDIGWSWNTLNTPEESKQKDLTGFSHGASGISWALLELYQKTEQVKYRDAAEQGFRYERHWFNPQHKNWPDFRNLYDLGMGGSKEPSYSLAWCHGAPGIGLSRLRAYQISGEKIYLEEAEIAIKTTEKMLNPSTYDGQSNFSLCHGLSGNAELLLCANQILNNTDYLSIVDQTGRQGIERYEKNRIPWPCGVQGGGETPNLMLGTAGIGYFYLRLYDHGKIPSVLMILPNSTKKPISKSKKERVE